MAMVKIVMTNMSSMSVKARVSTLEARPDSHPRASAHVIRFRARILISLSGDGLSYQRFSVQFAITLSSFGGPVELKSYEVGLWLPGHL